MKQISKDAQERAKILKEQNLTAKQMLDIVEKWAPASIYESLTKSLETASLLYAMMNRNKQAKNARTCNRWAEFHETSGAY